MIEKKFEKLIDQAIKELEYDDCFLVDLRVNNNKVEIFLDSDDSITFLKCRKVSRFIEAVIDEEQWLGIKYTLDVSSAGVGKPLIMTRQYLKNIGRDIEVKIHGEEKEKVLGELVAASEESISVYYEEIVKEGKKKKTLEITREILREEIREAKIKISFKKK
ncbi:MAG: ribosome maturation factor RimP [Halioglobus sp.]|jgi:ribosome maturation factor RimP